MNTDRYLFLMVVLLSIAHSHADVLELKNGSVLNGKYAGGTATTVRFSTNGGEKIFDTGQIVALTFTTTASSGASSSSAPPPAGSSSSVTLPAGTTLLVRMMDGISSQNPAGTTFTTKLEYDLVQNGGVAVKGGTVVYGKVQSSTQAGRALGKSTLDLRLSQIVVSGQQPVSLTTSGYQQAGQASIAKAAKGAAAGATIGAIAGDAGLGAAIGATAGALVRGKSVTIPPGTLLEFTLQSPATVTAPK